ncbi:Superfamily II DNA or RNA helicase [Pedobacter westerhofensis]|uniref:Superfamily II DNA or RNA helicase n=1 Tax=Pedobacter westerhofensis TaxID=425512 RepID=A0A521FSE2_9SPHI|nr:DEAD/DEAH box helicase family protein [Pedobacter westerhofensis]SMO99118.1 Superfamily II DNA or RNA helicase [Pedobacter westerhofensis]
MNCFTKGYNKLQLFQQKNNKAGLYKNQIGAIGSVLSHFSTRSGPALITMPTGTGKTAVMVVLSYALQGQKILVITPSQLVREQITKNFRDPKVLLEKGIIPGGRLLPRVYELTSVINDKKEWAKILKSNDVVVAIPGTLNKVEDLTETIGEKAFDLVFVDEAHHSRAKSWINILEAFDQAKQVLLTATPFRRDNRDLKARLVYNYSLKQAYEDGLFSKIQFIPVVTANGTSDLDKNIAIAKKAEEIYKVRLHNDHRIIIRTDRRKDADELHKIYGEHTKLKLAVVHSELSTSTIKSRIDQLTKGEIDGVICVNIMGEGYDFPALKIAAVHIPHKSLAITLQFVGRISRTNTAEGSLATVIAGEHEFKLGTHQLYKEDTKDWSVILPDLHKHRIQKTEDEQDFFDSFEDVTEDQEPIALEYEEPLSLADDDLRPFFHAKVYKIIPPKILLDPDDEAASIDITRLIDFSGTEALKNAMVRHHHVSKTHDVAIHVVAELKTPSWYIKDDKLKDVKNEFFIVYHDKDNSLFFIGATLKDPELYEHIVTQYLEDEVLHDIVHLPLLKRAMAGWREPKFYNVGLRSRKNKGNSESYKQFLGSLAQNSVSATDKFSYTRGHSFGGAYDTVLKKDLLLGVTSSSKVWALEDKKIKYFVEWCAGIARKVGDPEMDKLESPLSDLDTGKVIDEFPAIPVFFADWDHSQYSKNTTIVFLDVDEEAVCEALLCSCDIKVVNQGTSLLTLEISKADYVSTIEYSLNPKAAFVFSATTLNTIAVSRGNSFGSPEAFLAILNDSPVNIFFEDLSKLVGKVYFEFRDEGNRTISDDQIIGHNWPVHVEVKKEYFSDSDIANNKLTGNTKISIHEYIIELAKQDYDVVFYDHGSLEIADVIGLKKGKVQFWHCKKQAGDEPNCNVDDIYDVCGQAVKSVNWANRNLLIKQLYDRADRNKSNSKIKKGNLIDLKAILDSFDNPVIPVEITIVQPGLKTQSLSTKQRQAFDRIKVVLSGAESFLKDVSGCSLSIMCS